MQDLKAENAALKAENDALKDKLNRAHEQLIAIRRNIDAHGGVQSRLDRMLADMLERSTPYFEPGSPPRTRIEEVITTLRICAKERSAAEWQCLNCGATP
jgi:hypothetical protein